MLLAVFKCFHLLISSAQIVELQDHLNALITDNWDHETLFYLITKGLQWATEMQ